MSNSKIEIENHVRASSKNPPPASDLHPGNQPHQCLSEDKPASIMITGEKKNLIPSLVIALMKWPSPPSAKNSGGAEMVVVIEVKNLAPRRDQHSQHTTRQLCPQHPNALTLHPPDFIYRPEITFLLL